MWRREPRTWMELLVSKLGYRNALRVASFIVCWALVEDDLGERPTVEQYAAWWGSSNATAYRDLQAFREALPWFEYPTGFLAVAGRDLAAPAPAQYLREVT